MGVRVGSGEGHEEDRGLCCQKREEVSGKMGRDDAVWNFTWNIFIKDQVHFCGFIFLSIGVF